MKAKEQIIKLLFFLVLLINGWTSLDFCSQVKENEDCIFKNQKRENIKEEVNFQIPIASTGNSNIIIQDSIITCASEIDAYEKDLWFIKIDGSKGNLRIKNSILHCGKILINNISNFVLNGSDLRTDGMSKQGDGTGPNCGGSFGGQASCTNVNLDLTYGHWYQGFHFEAFLHPLVSYQNLVGSASNFYGGELLFIFLYS